jgi:hypothetical protein
MAGLLGTVQEAAHVGRRWPGVVFGLTVVVQWRFESLEVDNLIRSLGAPRPGAGARLSGSGAPSALRCRTPHFNSPTPSTHALKSGEA